MSWTNGDWRKVRSRQRNQYVQRPSSTWKWYISEIASSAELKYTIWGAENGWPEMRLYQKNKRTEANHPAGEEKQLKDCKGNGIRFVFQKHRSSQRGKWYEGERAQRSCCDDPDEGRWRRAPSRVDAWGQMWILCGRSKRKWRPVRNMVKRVRSQRIPSFLPWVVRGGIQKQRTG